MIDLQISSFFAETQKGNEMKEFLINGWIRFAKKRAMEKFKCILSCQSF